jgi:DNA polymerase III epsilon subunit-like protein
MKLLVFDTETTGLPPKSKTLKNEELHLWPYIVQFSYIVYDTETHGIVKIKDDIIHIPIEMCQEVIDIHGITNDMARASTCLINNSLQEFYADLLKVDQLIAHNFQFDWNMIQIELMRLAIREKTHNEDDLYISILKTIQEVPTENIYCTMTNSTARCDLKMRSKFGKEFVKFPKLSELHNHLFGVVPRNLHNSLNDVVICLRCYYKLVLDMDIQEKSVEIKKLLLELV